VKIMETHEENEMGSLQRLLLRGLRHVDGPGFGSYNKHGEWAIWDGDYQLTLLCPNRYPPLNGSRDQLDAVKLRISCSYPLYDREGVRLWLATIEGLSRITETNYVDSSKRPSRYAARPAREWIRATYGFDAILDVRRRQTLLPHFLQRLVQE
jgi:hypothetical protein